MAGDKKVLKKEFIRTMRKDLAGVPEQSAPIVQPEDSLIESVDISGTKPVPVVQKTEDILEKNDVLQAELKERNIMEEKIRQEEEQENEEKMMKEIAWQRELERIKLGAAGSTQKKPDEGKAVFELEAKNKEATLLDQTQTENARLETVRRELEEKEKQKEEEKRKRELLEKEIAERIKQEEDFKKKTEETARLEDLEKKAEEEKKKIEILKQEEEMRKRLEILQKESDERKREVERLKQEDERKRTAEDEKKKREEEEILRREELKRREEELKIKEEEEKKIKELGRTGVLSMEEEEGSMVSYLEREREESAKVREQIKREDLQKKIRDERQRKEQNPEDRKRFLFEKKRKLGEERARFQKELRQIASQKKPLEAPKMVLLKEIDGIRKASSEIFDKEQKIKEEELLIEKKEAEAQTVREKKQIEKARWAIEDKRRSLEMRRWPWEEKMKEINEKIKKIDSQFLGFEEKEEIVKKKEKDVFEKEKNTDLELEQLDLGDRLEKINEIKRILEEEKRALFDDIDSVEEKLDVVYSEESAVEEEVKKIEEEVKEVKDFDARKKLEKKRWNGEEKRRKVESNKWQLENEKEGKENQLKINEGKLNDLLKKENNVTSRIREIEKEINVIDNINQPVNKIVSEEEKPMATKPILSAVGVEKNDKKPQAEENLVRELEDKIIKSQKPKPKVQDESFEKEIQEIAKEKNTSGSPDETNLKIEEAKKRLEELKKADVSQNSENERIKAEIENDIKDERKNVSPSASRPVKEVSQTLVEKPVVDVVEKEEPKTEIQPESVVAPHTESVVDLSKEKNDESKMMGSVVVDNEEEKARKQLIAKLQTQPQDKRFATVASSAAVRGNVSAEKKSGDKKEINFGSAPDSIPLKPSSKEKLWTRVGVFGVILALLTGVVTFWYWWFIIKNQPPPVTIECNETSNCATSEICKDGKCVAATPKCLSNTDCTSDQTCDPSGNCVAAGPTIEAPPPLFGVDVSLTREASISSLDGIKSILTQWVEEDQEKNTFRRLLIKTNDGKYVSLKDILNSLEVRVPADFYSDFGDNYTLFSYSQPEGNRIGIVVEVAKTQELSNTMRTEESSMKEDFSPLLNIIHVGDPAKVQQFRDAISLPGYKGPNFRYLTTSTRDVGLCYIVSQDRFIFTTSITSMGNLVERMAIEMPVIELTKDLDSKSQGDDVKLLQTWLASDASIYTGKVSGTYDAATKEAVRKFQNKYASEILAPQGIYEGTGNVDERTRMKLNELYAKSGIRPRGTELINDLRFGSNGDEVRLLQTWLAKDSTIYPEGLVTGWFGSLTERAVKKFQEKYNKEILIPNGLNAPTGIVDKATRAKLNSLYKK